MGKEGMGRQTYNTSTYKRGPTFVSASETYKPKTHSLTDQCGTSETY